MADTLEFPKSGKNRQLHMVGYAILAVGLAMMVAGHWFAEGPLAGLLPLFGGIDLVLGAALISYRRQVVIDLGTHMVTFRRWVLFPIREQKFIPGAFDHAEIRGTAKGGYSVYLGGNRSLFIDGPVELARARAWALQISERTGWKMLEHRDLEGS